MENIRSDIRRYQQDYYGGYCNKARDLGLEPIPYHVFTTELEKWGDVTKKERMDALIAFTKTYPH